MCFEVCSFPHKTQILLVHRDSIIGASPEARICIFSTLRPVSLGHFPENQLFEGYEKASGCKETFVSGRLKVSRKRED